MSLGLGADRFSMRGKLCLALVGAILVLCLMVAPADTSYAADAQFMQMYKRAVDFPQGDLSRLANVIKKAQAGEMVTIGFLGGSITEGGMADSVEDCYVSRVSEWWKEAFPGGAVNVVNAGLGGTSSYLGIHRVDSEILAYEPDLVFIEFAVNDSFTEFCMGSYENLIRRILASKTGPALILLFATKESGDSSQPAEEALGEYYGLPMISYGRAVIPEVKAGNLAWSEISGDSVHPNNLGHAIFARLITSYLENIRSKIGKIKINPGRLGEYELPPPATPQAYQDARIENAMTIAPVEMKGYTVCNYNYHFPYNWYSVAEDSCLSFAVEARNIGVIYQRTVDGTFGQYDVYVDGKRVRTLDGDFAIYQGTETEAEEVYASPDGGKAWHEVKIVRNPESANVDFVIVGLLIS